MTRDDFDNHIVYHEGMLKHHQQMIALYKKRKADLIKRQKETKRKRDERFAKEETARIISSLI